MEEGIMTTMDFLHVLRSWWEETHPGGTRPGCDLRTAQRIGHRLGLSWRRAHGKKGPAVDEERKAAFLEEIRHLALRTVPREYVINADESAFLRYVAGAYRSARRGAEGIQLTYTLMVAITFRSHQASNQAYREGEDCAGGDCPGRG
jgi:hypothetical protein